MGSCFDHPHLIGVCCGLCCFPPKDSKSGIHQCLIPKMLFQTTELPTCQVRVVRFYQSCSSPPPSSSFFLLLLRSSSSTTSASTSTSTVALPTLGQALRQLRSSVRTAGPQPGTFPAQCAPLDLNLGPS